MNCTNVHCLSDVIQKELEAGQLDAFCVSQFARAMTAKLVEARKKGRHSWQFVPVDRLWQMLRDHVEKGDPIDVANFAMFIWQNSQEHAANNEYERKLQMDVEAAAARRHMLEQELAKARDSEQQALEAAACFRLNK